MIRINQMGRKVRSLFPWGSFVYDVMQSVRAIRTELDQLYEKMNECDDLTDNNWGSDEETHERQFTDE